MKSLALAAVTATLLGLMSTACTVHQAEQPALTGPSEFALSLSMNAIPDSISQDGGSQSAVRVVAKGRDGQAIASLSMRVDMAVNGVVADFGSLSARSIVTGADGTATVVYTAPPQNPSGLTGTCASVPGTCVTIIATPTGTNFQTSNSQIVVIRLVPPGVILPPAGTPTAAFTFSPANATTDQTLLFDASTSQVGNGANQIVSYNWTFGDGTTGTGKTVTHAYTSQNAYDVTLTVTNDRTLSASTTRSVNVAAAATPTASFVFSPATPFVDQAVTFDASTSTPANGPGGGQPIVSYTWTFGDNTASQTTSSTTFSHTYGFAGVYAVTLVVRDSAGRNSPSKTSSVTVATAVPCGDPLLPCATLTVSQSPTAVNTPVTLKALVSSPGTGVGTSITNYQWDFGDGTPQIATAGNEINHTYTRRGTFTVKLIMTNSNGRFGSATITVLVQ